MNKILCLNSLSDGNKYLGNEIKGWLDEFYSSITTYSDTKNNYVENIEILLDLRPNIIITVYSEIENILPIYFYKLCFPDTKIISLVRDWRCVSKKDLNKLNKRFFEECSLIIILNSSDSITPFNIQLENMLFPIDYIDFYIETPWIDRTEKFIYLGDINESKFSSEFINLLNVDTKINTTIDCFGTMTNNIDYVTLFNSCPTLVYKGIINQENVKNTLNKYKYFIFPNVTEDTSNISLMQAMFCGVIPLILNDTTKTIYTKWLNWAKNICIEKNTLPDFFTKFKKLIENDENEKFSEIISNTMQQRSNRDKFKQLLSSTIESLLEP